MSDTLKKVLLGAVAGALIAVFVSHLVEVRGKHVAPKAGGPPGGAPAAAGRPGGPGGAGGPGGGSFSQRPVEVVAVQARSERLSFEMEALGTTRANESIDVTSKVVNQVTAVRFEEGQQVRRGQVLVELDAEQVRADLAAAEAALVESRSQFERSRELAATKILSDSQLEQIEATYKGNEARVGAARARVNDTVVRAPFDGRVGLRRVSVGSLVSPGTVITTLDDTRTIKLDFTIPETFLSVVQPGLEISARSVAYPDRNFGGKVSSIDSRRPGDPRRDRARAAAERGGAPEARHVPDGAALARRGGRAARARGSDRAGAGRDVRVRRRGRPRGEAQDPPR
jgi:multidrug efflux pump subunit AcrA (membrane-fusion protein)